MQGEDDDFSQQIDQLMAGTAERGVHDERRFDEVLAAVRDDVARMSDRIEALSGELARELSVSASHIAVRLETLETAVGQVVGIEALGGTIQRPMSAEGEGPADRLDDLEQRIALLADDVGELLGSVDRRLGELERTLSDRLAAELQRAVSERLAGLREEVVASVRERAGGAEGDRYGELAALLEEAIGGLSRRRRQQVLDRFRLAASRWRRDAGAGEPRRERAEAPRPAKAPAAPATGRAPAPAADEPEAADELLRRALGGPPAGEERPPGRAPRSAVPRSEPLSTAALAARALASREAPAEKKEAGAKRAKAPARKRAPKKAESGEEGARPAAGKGRAKRAPRAEAAPGTVPPGEPAPAPGEPAP